MIRTMTFVVAAAILSTVFRAPAIFAQAASPNPPDPTEVPKTPGDHPSVVVPAPRVVLPAPAPRVAVPVAPAPRAASAASRTTVVKGALNDSLFAIVAVTSGMSGIAISELGKQRVTDPELKHFSEQAIQDHAKLNRELTALAAQKRIALPSQIDACGQFREQSLAAESGGEFDRCYAETQLIIHMEAVATFQSEAKHGMDPDVKAFASKALPILKSHLKMIKPIAMKYHEKEKGATETHARAGSSH